MAEYKLAPFFGLDNYSFKGLIKDGYSPKLYNVETEGGILFRCKGTKKQFSKDNCNMMLKHFYKDGTSKTLLLRNGNIEDAKTGEIIKENFYEPNSSISYINYQLNETYITIFCSEGKAPIKYDGEVISDLAGSPPKCAFVELHNERVFMTGDRENPDRVYYSDSFNPESWNVELKSGYIDLPSWDGGKIRGIKSLFGDLIVFKDYGIFRIYGTYPGEFAVEKIPSSVGCSNGGTIASCSDRCYFLSDKGLCYFNGVMAKLIEDKRLKAVFDKMDFSRMSEAKIINYGSRLFMFLPFFEEDLVVEYDYSQNILLIKKGFKVKQFIISDGLLYFIDQNGFVCLYNSGDLFDTQPIKSYWRSKDIDLGSKSTIKWINDFYMLAKGTKEIVIRVVGEKRTTEKTIRLNGDFKDYIIPINARGRRFYIEIENKDGSDFVLDSPTLHLDIEED